jgi:REP element-mobilizing transposase RayT
MQLKKSMSQKLRMGGRDYSRPGWYFVTLGADYHKHLFGLVEGCEMRANALGRLVETCWREIPEHYGHIELGAFQLMPNHFHGLVRIVRSGGKGLGEVMNVFKGAVTREWRRSGVSRYSGKVHGEEPEKIWAPNYYDVICFQPEELEVREKYVRANPRRWALKSMPKGRIKQSRYKGNVELLKMMPRRALRVSRRASEAEITGLQKELAEFDGIVCCTFFSPGERACLKTLLEGKSKIIWVLPMAMPEAVPVKWTDAFLEERALWVSAFSDDLEEATRASCEQANCWVKRFVEQENENDR